MSPANTELQTLHRFVESHDKIVVLTGAGISAPSGIPTYRDENGVWLRADPIKHQEFLLEHNSRRRYWGRSLMGWPAVSKARPSSGHIALETLERRQRIQLLITQNVDRLHQRAGSRNVVDLHGRLDRVRCLHCSALYHRDHIQQQLASANSELFTSASSPRPDGDADVPDHWIENIRVPDCDACGGMLMPDVVFFGGTVPRARVEHCMQAVAEADAILAVGTSLQVFSGYRFCRRAAELGKTIALINPGKTRADPLADLKLRSECGPLLTQLVSIYA